MNPGELSWIGPITPGQARELATAAAADPDCTWRLIVTDEQGRAIAITTLHTRHGTRARPPRTPGLVSEVTITISRALAAAFGHETNDWVARAIGRANSGEPLRDRLNFEDLKPGLLARAIPPAANLAAARPQPPGQPRTATCRRLRTPHANTRLPGTRPAPPLAHHPRPHLPQPHLPPARHPMRPRPHHRIPPRRPHLLLQPRRTMPPPPRTQATPRLAPSPQDTHGTFTRNWQTPSPPHLPQGTTPLRDLEANRQAVTPTVLVTRPRISSGACLHDPVLRQLAEVERAGGRGLADELAGLGGGQRPVEHQFPDQGDAHRVGQRPRAPRVAGGLRLGEELARSVLSFLSKTVSRSRASISVN